MKEMPSGQWEKLKSSPDTLAAKAMEEVLRYESPVPRAVRRTFEDVEICGKRIPRGALVVFLLSADFSKLRTKTIASPRRVY